LDDVLASLGGIALAVALPAAAYGVAALALGLRRRALAEESAAPGAGGRLVESGYRALLAVTLLLTAAMVALWVGFVRDDFALAYVADHSERALPLVYKLAALWGGNEGSLLFWAWVLALYTAVVLRGRDPEAVPFVPYAAAVLGGVLVFFLGVLNFLAPPFARSAVTPADGAGLNPLLQDAYMAIHPPMLYGGFVGFAVPYAFAMAALLARRPGVAWIRVTRKWTLLAFLFLSTGILLGAHWAYHELGWGGYWGWDPVENASLLPWLTGTAFLHSSMIEERRGMFKRWNMLLVTVTFCLTVFGTFLTRSGVLNSVHAFANSGLGPYFMGFIGVAAVFSLWLILDRWELLANERELESAVSKEASFLFNNVLFLGATFAVLWGTVFPLVSEAVRGVKVTVGPPYFNTVMVPVGIVLTGLMGVGPLIAWRRASLASLWRAFGAPLTFGAAILAGAALLGVRRWGALLAFAAASFAVATVVADAWRAMRVRRRVTGDPWGTNALRLLGRNRHRYGGYLVHVAVALMVIGFAGSGGYQVKAQGTLAPGQALRVGPYTLVQRSVGSVQYPERRFVFADLDVLRGGRFVASLQPGANVYAKQPDQPTTAVALRSTLEDDLYVILAGTDGTRATLIAYVNPLVAWIWIGQVLLILGTLWALWPEGRRVAVPAGAPSDARGMVPAGAAR
jgi:cytochrome c-type biogenesis protein CcmF